MPTIDPFAVLVAQESDDLGDVDRDSTPTKRAHLGDASLNLRHRGVLGSSRGVVPSVRVEHVGLDSTGGNRIDGDTLVASIGGEGSGEALNSSLGASIQS